MTGCLALTHLRLLRAGVHPGLGGVGAAQMTQQQPWYQLMGHVFRPYSSHTQYQNGEKEKIKPYFVLLAIYYEEPLKHF